MAKKETASPAIPVFPMLKTVEQMSKISGIGENKLRELMDSGELSPRHDREVKLWLYQQGRLRINATATAY